MNPAFRGNTRTSRPPDAESATYGSRFYLEEGLMSAFL